MTSEDPRAAARGRANDPPAAVPAPTDPGDTTVAAPRDTSVPNCSRGPVPDDIPVSKCDRSGAEPVAGESGAGARPGAAADDPLARALVVAGLADEPGAAGDPLARALVAAGLADEPGAGGRAEPAADDPLARALAAAGLVAPPLQPDDPLAAAGLADRRSAPAVSARAVVAEPERGPEPDPLPRWPDGAATAIGSMPGTDPAEAAGTVVGELPLMPHLVELPARGVGADMIGRTAGLLVDLAVEVQPTAYRVTQRPGHEHRRAVDLLRFDVDAFDEACDAARPSWVKVQAAGPWTLAAAVELRNGHRVLTDHGAVREFTESLVEGLRLHVAEIAARTRAQVLVQLDEPGLPAVLAGSLPTPSGYGSVSAVPEPRLQDVLRGAVDALDVPVVVHCCAPQPPVRLLAGAGVAGIGIDMTCLSEPVDTGLLDALGETWDAGTPLLLGLVPALAPARRVTVQELARPAFDLADRLGFDRVRLAALAVPTPACGLAGASPEWARRALRLGRELGEMFADPPERG